MVTLRQLLRAIGDEPVAVGVLAERVAVGRPAVSKHLKVLQGAGLVSHHSVGTRNVCALAPEGYAVAQRCFADTWTAALTAFDLGCARVLTSGGAATAAEGVDVISRLVEAAPPGAIVLPGCGVRSDNAAQLRAATGVTELHASLRYFR